MWPINPRRRGGPQPVLRNCSQQPLGFTNGSGGAEQANTP
jgi:hypothetical protein